MGHHVRNRLVSDVSKNGWVRNSKSPSFNKARKKLAKPVRYVFGMWETNLKLAAIRGTLKYDELSNPGRNRELSGMWHGPIPREVAPGRKQPAIRHMYLVGGSVGSREGLIKEFLSVVCFDLSGCSLQGKLKGPACTSPNSEFSQCWGGCWSRVTENTPRQMY